MTEVVPSSELLVTCAKIAAAHFSNSAVPLDEVAEVISQIYQSVAKAAAGGSSNGPKEPAVPIAKSVMADRIVCLEDGAKLKTLKPHLRVSHGLNIAEYRTRWHLPADYPAVAPNYAKRRSAIAKQIGLGKAARQRKRAR
jgi:predicted transcriptional regulator